MEDATFVDLLGKEKLQTIQKNNLPKILVQIYKSKNCFTKHINNFCPPIM